MGSSGGVWGRGGVAPDRHERDRPVRYFAKVAEPRQTGKSNPPESMLSELEERMQSGGGRRGEAGVSPRSLECS